MRRSKAMSPRPHVVALFLVVAGAIGASGPALKGVAAAGFPIKKTPQTESIRCTEDSHCGFYTGYCGEGACECAEMLSGQRRCRPGDDIVLCDVEPCTGKISRCEGGYCAVLDPPLAEGPNLSPGLATTITTTTSAAVTTTTTAAEAAATTAGSTPAAPTAQPPEVLTPTNICKTDADCEAYFITEKDESDPWGVCSCQALPKDYPDVGCQGGPCMAAMCLEHACKGKSAVCDADMSCQLIDVAYVPPPNVCETDEDCEAYFITMKDESDPWGVCSCHALPKDYPDIGCQSNSCMAAKCLEPACEGKSAVCGADASCQLIDALPTPCADDGDCRKFFEGCDCSCTALHVTDPDPVWTKSVCARCMGNSCDDKKPVCNIETNVCELQAADDPELSPPTGGGEVCGDSVCNVGDVCCNDSCGICTPPGGACIKIACLSEPVVAEPTPVEEQVRTCADDSECKLVDDYCGGCNCLALFQDLKPAPCDAEKIVNCFVEPCMNQKAQCVDGECSAVSSI